MIFAGCGVNALSGLQVSLFTVEPISVAHRAHRRMRRKRLIRPTGFAVYRRANKHRATGHIAGCGLNALSSLQASLFAVGPISVAHRAVNALSGLQVSLFAVGPISVAHRAHRRIRRDRLIRPTTQRNCCPALSVAATFRAVIRTLSLAFFSASSRVQMV